MVGQLAYRARSLHAVTVRGDHLAPGLVGQRGYPSRQNRRIRAAPYRAAVGQRGQGSREHTKPTPCNLASVGQLIYRARALHTVPTPHNLAMVGQLVYRARSPHTVIVPGDHLARGLVGQLGYTSRLNRRLRAALNRATVGQLGQGLAVVVHAIGRAFNRPAVGHARIAGRRLGDVNPRATLALNRAAVGQRRQGTRAHTMPTA